VNAVTWFAFGLALVSAALWVALVVVAVLLWGKARPIVQAYGPMVSAMMPAAAGTGGIENVATSSPAATLDQCEYSDHEWSTATSCMDGALTHYCIRCGYTEHVPGT
jgi:hypothetical protein